MSIEDNFYRLGTVHGVLKQLFLRNQFDLCKQNLLSLNDVKKDTEIIIRSAVGKLSVTGVTQGYKIVSERRYSVLQTTKFTTKSESFKAMLDTITYTQRKKRTIIYIMVNGKSCEPPCKIVFIEDDLHDWDGVLQYLGLRLNVPEGIQYICTVKGEIVFEADQLHHGDLYIGVPFGESFEKEDYVKMFYDLIKQQKKKSGYIAGRNDRKNKMNLPTSYAPWSVKHRKARRFSATILNPSPLNKISPKNMTFPGRYSPRSSLQTEAS